MDKPLVFPPSNAQYASLPQGGGEEPFHLDEAVLLEVTGQQVAFRVLWSKDISIFFQNAKTWRNYHSTTRAQQVAGPQRCFFVAEGEGRKSMGMPRFWTL